MNCFIADPTPTRLTKLREAGIVFADLTIEGVPGIVFEEGELQQALVAMSCQVKETRPTPLEGIVEIILKRGAPHGATPLPAPVPELTVKIDGHWNGLSHTQFYEIAKKILLPVVKKNILMSVPHQKTVPPVEDGNFRILLWSSPGGELNVVTPLTMWGITVSCRDTSFAPFGTGIAIVDPITSHAVAELVGNNLYIHHDICHRGTMEELRIFERICEETVAEMSLSPEEKAERQRRFREEARKNSREAYIKECSGRRQKVLEGTRRAIANGEMRIGQLQTELTQTIREVAGQKRKLEQVLSSSGDEAEKYAKEFDKLLSIPKILDVKVANGVLHVFTDTLYCVDPRTDKKHEIGKFRIEIYTNCERGGVRWFNLTRVVTGYEGRRMHAPHVFEDGVACYGNTAEIWPELIANYEFAAVAMVAIQFIESVNVEDLAGKHIDKWPVAA